MPMPDLAATIENLPNVAKGIDAASFGQTDEPDQPVSAAIADPSEVPTRQDSICETVLDSPDKPASIGDKSQIADGPKESVSSGGPNHPPQQTAEPGDEVAELADGPPQISKPQGDAKGEPQVVPPTTVGEVVGQSEESKTPESDEPGDLFNSEVQTTRREQYQERDRLNAEKEPETKRERAKAKAKAKSEVAKKKQEEAKAKAKAAKEAKKAKAKAKAAAKKEKQKQRKVAAKAKAKAKAKGKKAKACDDADADDADAKSKPKRSKKEKTQPEIYNDPSEPVGEPSAAAAAVGGEAPAVEPAGVKPDVVADPKPRKRKASEPAAAEAIPDAKKEKLSFARRYRGTTEKAGNRWDNIKAAFMELVGPKFHRPSKLEDRVTKTKCFISYPVSASLLSKPLV